MKLHGWLSYLCFLLGRCQSIREEKQRKEQAEAQKKAEEEERRRRKEEEEARRKAMEEEERKRVEEEVRRIAMEEEEAAKMRTEQKKKEEEKNRLAREPQTREDLDIELVTEEMLDDNLCVQGTTEEREKKHKEVNTISHIKEELDKGKELEDEEQDIELNGTVVEAGPQLDKKEEETVGWSDSKPSLLSGVTSNAFTPTSPDEGSDKQPTTPFSTSPNAEQTRVIQRSQSSKSQEKREQRRRRGLEHNQRETERAASSSSSSSLTNNQQEAEQAGKDEASPPKSNTPEVSKLKERSDSKELDQYTFVEWKMKEDKGGKKEPKASPSPPAGPVRPSTLALQPAESPPVRNGVGEGEGGVTLQRRPGGMKERPEKWRARRSEGEHFDSTAIPPHDSKRQQMYVLDSGHLHTCQRLPLPVLPSSLLYYDPCYFK